MCSDLQECLLKHTQKKNFKYIVTAFKIAVTGNYTFKG